MVAGPVIMSENGPSSFPFTGRSVSASPRADPVGVSRVRRCLFGPRVAGESERFLRQETEEQRRHDRLRYNFDFEKGEPLPPDENQRFEWVPVSTNSAQPPVESRLGREAKSDDDRELENEAGGAVSKTTSPSAKFVQTKLSDFMKSRKRPLSSSKLPVSREAKVRRTSTAS